VRPIDAARRADADNGEIGIVKVVREPGGRLDPAIGMGGGDQVNEPGLGNRRAAFVEGSNLGLADIDADDRVALAGDAACSGRADLAQSENGNLHDESRKVRPCGRRTA
jgi:hypothetical protein